MDCNMAMVVRSQLSWLWRCSIYVSCTFMPSAGNLRACQFSQATSRCRTGRRATDAAWPAGDIKSMLDFVKPYLPGNAPLLDQAVCWMRRDQREAFFNALHALGAPISPGMLSSLIRGHAAMHNAAAARVAFGKWTAQGVPTTIDVWKALASIHVHESSPQAGVASCMARFVNCACCTALPGTPV